MQLLKLRYLQVKRDLGYWVVITALLVFFISKSICEFSELSPWLLGGSVVVFLYMYHQGRKDLAFIAHYFSHPKRELSLTYSLLLLPVTSAMLVSRHGLPALGLHAAAILIACSPTRRAALKLGFISKLVHAAQFEWVSGIRKNFLLLLPLLALALFFSPVKLFASIALFLINSIFLGFYGNFEPRIMLNPADDPPALFLRKKISFFHKVLLLFNLPVLLVNSVVQPDIAWYNACFLTGFLTLASSSVYLKYAHYRPNDELRFHIDYLLLFASALIPFLLPLAFLLNYSHKKKALQHLKAYTDAHA